MMIKKNALAMSVSLAIFVVSGAANAAEIYNKAGNKLDFYGKAVGEHKFTTTGHTGNSDSSYGRSGYYLPVLIAFQYQQQSQFSELAL